ncbi:hypothetical protein ACFOLF_25915 [Paenibacillus sepulcri]|uniref:Uncharacterized protein n=1 Tax=Paenibacillus sepulcri TaxID=359917 RepID=A0ABS7BVP0_9BACL|nr:hypothetical protein [Paenibacillus sepulcri]
MPEVVYVNSSWAGLPAGTVVGPGMIIGTNAFATIQEGVNAVATQGTVQVAAGLYNEPLINVLRPMQLHGAQYGVDARTRSGSSDQESIVQGNIANGTFVLTAEAIVIDGLRFKTTQLDRAYRQRILLRDSGFSIILFAIMSSESI